MIILGLILSLSDMLLITFFHERPLPHGVGILLPIGIGIAYIGGLIKEMRKDE